MKSTYEAMSAWSRGNGARTLVEVSDEYAQLRRRLQRDGRQHRTEPPPFGGHTCGTEPMVSSYASMAKWNQDGGRTLRRVASERAALRHQIARGEVPSERLLSEQYDETPGMLHR